MIVEAKREGEYFELPLAKKAKRYRIQTLVTGNAALRRALVQVAAYCQSAGCAIAVVTNGHQFVVFIASRDDGKPPLEGDAIAFISLQQIAEEFVSFWNLLSKQGVQERNLQRNLLSDFVPPKPPKLSRQIHPYPGCKARNALQADLQNLSAFVFEDIPKSREFEQRFLKDCYCATSATSQYALLSKNFLRNRYSAIFEGLGSPPLASAAPDGDRRSSPLLAEAVFRRPILLIGDVGAGKTTFIRHLIAIDAAEIFENAITLYIDFGSQGALQHDIKEFVVDAIERQLLADHGLDIREAAFVRGIYNLDMLRFAKGVNGILRTSDPTEYERRELAELDRLMKDPEQHMIRALQHIALGHRKQVVLFLDNVDQRSDDVQQTVFVISHSIAANWPVAAFLAIRPETFRRSKVSGALSAYHTKAFTIAPARSDLVLKKRVAFALAVLSGEIEVASLSSISKDSAENLQRFLRSLASSLDGNRELLELFDNVSGGNLRSLLDLVVSVIGSGHIDTRKIVAAGPGYRMPVHEALRALLFGEGEFYDPKDSVIANLFDIATPDAREHFLLPILLDYAFSEGKRTDSGFVAAESVVGHLAGLGFTSHQIGWAMSRAYSSRLVETSDRVRPVGQAFGGGAIRLTTLGAYHLLRLPEMFTYLDAIMIDTPILDDAVEASLAMDNPRIRARLRNVEAFIGYLGKAWSTLAPSIETVFDWKQLGRRAGEEVAQIRAHIGTR